MTPNMTQLLIVKNIDWKYGLWDNHGFLAINWPNFSKEYLNGKKFSYKYLEKFYYNYNKGDIVEPINFNFNEINDIVTSNSVWNYTKKINLYFKVDE